MLHRFITILQILGVLAAGYPLTTYVYTLTDTIVYRRRQGVEVAQLLTANMAACGVGGWILFGSNWLDLIYHVGANDELNINTVFLGVIGLVMGVYFTKVWRSIQQ